MNLSSCHPYHLGDASGYLVGRYAVAQASWGIDEWIVFTPTSGAGLWRVSSNGGAPEVLSIPDRDRGEKSHRLPRLLPNGKAVLFTMGKGDQASWDDASIRVLSLETGEHRILVEGGMDAHYSPSGHVIYARDGALLALPFDPRELEVTGTPVPVARGVMTSFLHGQAEFAISQNGSLVFAAGDSWQEHSRVVQIDREGKTEVLLEEQEYRYVRFSPDGRSLFLVIEQGANSSMWIYDLTRKTLTRFESSFDNYEPIWSPDGNKVAFASNRSGAAFNLFWTEADGSGAPERLTESGNHQRNPVWSPDGTVLLFDELTPDSGRDLWFLSAEGDRTPKSFLRTEFNERNGQFSLDGRWIAYQSDESGQDEIYIQRFPGPGGKWQASAGGGTEPRWNQNGRELFYLNGTRLMAVDLDTDADLTLGKPRQLFERSSGLGNYDIAPDGQHFAIIEPREIEPPPPTQLILVQNWFQELKRLVPTNK